LLHAAHRFRSERSLPPLYALRRQRTALHKATHGGNDRNKRFLLLVADTARGTNLKLAEVYWRLTSATGRHNIQSLCAVANRRVNCSTNALRDADAPECSAAEAKPSTLQ
jgi:hypothetical protein